MYKLVCIDLDGTLLDDKKQVPKANADMINKINKEKGVFFVIATGRNFPTINSVAEQIGDSINQYVIAVNGAVIKDNVKNEYILEQYIKEEEILQIMDIYKKHNLRCAISTPKEPITEKCAKAEIGTPIKVVDDFKKYYLENDVSKTSMITFHGKREDLQQMRKELALKFGDLSDEGINKWEVNADDGLYKTNFMDVTRKNNSKGNGIKILAERLNIKKEEIIAIGDGTNDMSMFKVSGCKIAMKNSENELKEHADYVTEFSNNEAGVAKVLEKIFYKGEA